LAVAVPPAAGWRDTTLPPTLTAARVTALLDSCDRTSLTGLRDFAVLTVLARLGLRAAEVAGLELGDVDWRTGEIVVRGKGRRDERLPLSADGLCDDDGTHIGRPRVSRGVAASVRSQGGGEASARAADSAAGQSSG
jgi:site-specific recombinase XerC